MYNTYQHRTLREAQSLNNIPNSFRGNASVGETCLMNKQQPFNSLHTKSSMNWRPTTEDLIKHCRSSSLTRSTNRYQQHAKDGFVYRPMDNV
jgi:hypothetical protein